MDDKRRNAIIEELVRKGNEIRAIVGDDLPKSGYISIGVWEDSVLIEINKYWKDAPKSDRTVFEHFERIST